MAPDKEPAHERHVAMMLQVKLAADMHHNLLV
jgi:hypothetical protein